LVKNSPVNNLKKVAVHRFRVKDKDKIEDSEFLQKSAGTRMQP